MRLQVLFALAYGHRGPDGQGGYVPGLSNEAMALVAKTQKDRYYHVAVQQEIGTAMRGLGVEPDFEVLYGGRAYLTTEQIIDAMLEDLRQEGVDPKDCDINVLCHSIHWSDCKWILQARGIRPRKATLGKIPYDPDSHQFQGRNAFNAWLYKFWAGFTKLLKGEISVFGPKAQGVVMVPTHQNVRRRSRLIMEVILYAIVVAAVVVGAYAFIMAMASQTDVKVGQLYNIMLYSCSQAYDKGEGKIETEKMYDVVFIATNPRGMRRQLVRPAYTRQDDTIPKGQGEWVKVDRGTVQGIYYGWYTEFRYNGTLQPASQIPDCVQ